MKKSLLLMAAAALIMSACTQDVAEQDGAGAGVAGAINFAATSDGTRTAITVGEGQLDVTWVGGEDRIGIFAYDEAEMAAANAAYTAAESGSYSTFTTDDPLKWGEGAHDFYAYYPYDAEAAHYTAVYADVPAEQTQSAAGNIDHIAPMAFMYAALTDVAKTGATVDFSFQNAFSVVAISLFTTEGTLNCEGVVVRATEETEVVAASNICVSLATGAINFDSAEASNEVKVTLAEPAIINATSAQTLYALVTPGHAGKTFKVYAIVEGEEVEAGEVTIPETGIPASVLAPLAIVVPNEGEPEPEPEPDEPGVVNLSAKGVANCYIVNQAATTYKFRADVKGNGWKALSGDDTSLSAATKARILWAQTQTTTKPDTPSWPVVGGAENADNIIVPSSVKLREDGYVVFTTGEEMPNGNVGIVVTDDADNVLWSWHMWVCAGYDPASTDILVSTKGVNSYFMDRNIGAFCNYAAIENPDVNDHVASRGVYFQWGRKDPFIGHQSAHGYATFGKIYAADGSSKSPYVCYGGENLGDAVFQGQSYDEIAAADINSLVSWTVAHPNVFVQGTATSGYTWVSNGVKAAEGLEWTNLWGNAALAEGLGDKGGVKTMYDPCPFGYRVPSTGHYVFITSHGDQSSTGYGNPFRNWQYNTVEKIFDEEGVAYGTTDAGWAKSAPYGLHFYANGVKTASPDAQNGVQDYGVLPADQSSLIYFPAQGWIPYGFSTGNNGNEMQYQTNRPANGNVNCYRMACTNDGNFYYGWTKVNWGQAMGLPVRCVRDENLYVPAPAPKPEPEPDTKVDVNFGGTTEGYDSVEDAEDTSGYLTASNFTWNPEKKEGATVEDAGNGYVKITFTVKQQGFWVTNETQTSSSTIADIVIEDFQTFSNGEPVEITKGCGFYAVIDGTGTYFMSSTDQAKVFTEGVQFQTSNSGYGDQPMPLTILMKAKMTFK